jgi:hypothetical protein
MVQESSINDISRKGWDNGIVYISSIVQIFDEQKTNHRSGECHVYYERLTRAESILT